MVSVFCGQLMGTAVGNKLYAKGGWIASGSASVGFIGVALLCCFARAPWQKGWLGWSGGWGIRRRDLGPRQEPVIEEVLDELSAESGQEVGEGEKTTDNEKSRSRDGAREGVPVSHISPPALVSISGGEACAAA
jgi:hypothetical protein